IVPAVFLTEHFDSVAAGTLPAGWTTTILLQSPSTPTPGWTTTTASSSSAPNAAFSPDEGDDFVNFDNMTDSVLTSPAFTPTTLSQVTFQNQFNLEDTFDGAVLEISING